MVATGSCPPATFVHPCTSDGTRAELNNKRKKLQRAVARMLKVHRERDADSISPDIEAKEKQTRKKLRQQIHKLKTWLGENEDKLGKSGRPIKSNVTDNESAKMKTRKGVI